LTDFNCLKINYRLAGLYVVVVLRNGKNQGVLVTTKAMPRNKRLYCIMLCIMLIATIFALAADQVLAADKADKGASKGLYAKESYSTVRFETKLESIESGVKEKSTNRLALSSTWYWKQVTYSVTAYNQYGTALCKFYHKVYWEYDGTYVANVQRSSWGQVLFTGWEYAGLVGNTGYYFGGNTGYYSFYQGHFRFGTGGYYIEHTYPWIEVYVYGNGSCTGYGTPR